MKEDDDFGREIRSAQKFGKLAAQAVIVDDIVKNKNIETSKWYLEKKYPSEYGGKHITQQFNQFNQIDFNKEIAQARRERGLIP